MHSVTRACTAALLLALVLACLPMYGCADFSAARDYARAEREGTDEAFERFLQKYPNSPTYSDPARERAAQLAYNAARGLNTTAGYEAFLKKYPAADPYSRLAREAIEKGLQEIRTADFREAQRKGTAAAYQAFLEKDQDVAELSAQARTALANLTQEREQLLKVKTALLNCTTEFAAEHRNLAEEVIQAQGWILSEEQADVAVSLSLTIDPGLYFKDGALRTGRFWWVRLSITGFTDRKELVAMERSLGQAYRTACPKDTLREVLQDMFTEMWDRVGVSRGR